MPLPKHRSESLQWFLKLQNFMFKFFYFLNMVSASFPNSCLIICSRFLILFCIMYYLKQTFSITENNFLRWQAFAAYRSVSSGLRENVLTFNII